MAKPEAAPAAAFSHCHMRRRSAVTAARRRRKWRDGVAYAYDLDRTVLATLLRGCVRCKTRHAGPFPDVTVRVVIKPAFDPEIDL